MPDNRPIYNWIEAFFRDHEHCTRFGESVSQFRKILASIIQGSAIAYRPSILRRTASDLHPASTDNFIGKYADDTYLIIPAYNSQTCTSEIPNIEAWAAASNLKLNRLK